MSGREPPWVLQICHGYSGPFLDCARQYAALFSGTPYKVLTVFLTGAPDPRVASGCNSDEVVFFDFSSGDIRGLKLGAIRRVRQLVAQKRVVMCIAHRFKPTYIACLATRLPVIGINHAFGVYARPSRRFFAWLYRRRLSLLAVSHAVRDDLRCCLPAWPAERIETLHNRIDIQALRAELFSPQAAREALGLPADAWVVANVGRLHSDKDQATLIRAFALARPKLPVGAVLVILGQGKLRLALESLARELGVQESVRLLGQVPDGRRYFRAFDTFVLSSDREPFGMVLLEALAAAVPIISSDCGGAPEVVRDVGLLFPFGDAAALADAICLVAAADQQGMPDPAIEERLQIFSDEAARNVFWDLQMTAPLGRIAVNGHPPQSGSA